MASTLETVPAQDGDDGREPRHEGCSGTDEREQRKHHLAEDRRHDGGACHCDGRTDQTRRRWRCLGGGRGRHCQFGSRRTRAWAQTSVNDSTPWVVRPIDEHAMPRFVVNATRTVDATRRRRCGPGRRPDPQLARSDRQRGTVANLLCAGKCNAIQQDRGPTRHLSDRSDRAVDVEQDVMEFHRRVLEPNVC